MSRAKATTLPQIAQLIAAGQRTAKERWDELKADFDQKHKENVDRRHDLMDKYAALEGRVTILERDMQTVVGDNTGGSGLLHEIKGAVKELQSEMAIVKQVVQDTPAINKWVVGAAAIVAFIVVVVPFIAFIVFELLKLSKP